MKMKFSSLIISCLAIVFLVVSCNDSSTTEKSNTKKTKSYEYSMIWPEVKKKLDSNPSLTKEELYEAISLAGKFIARSADSIGRFSYVVNTNPDVKITPSYNMLRHAGAVYSLGMYHELSGDPEACEASTRAMEYVKQTALGPVTDGTYGIWTFKDITLLDKPAQVKLGGCGLGILAMSACLKCDPYFLEREKMVGMGEFIVFMQKKNGGFVSKYIPDRGGKYRKWNSLYYPGEAILGLMYLNRVHPDQKWVASAIHGMSYLAEGRKGQVEVEPDHWALIATNQLVNYIDNNEKYASFKQPFIDHAVQICEFILNTRAKFEEGSPYTGCFGFDGRTTPTATRLEGLLNAYNYIPEEYVELRKRMEVAIHEGVAFLVRSQIKEGEFIGGIPRTYIADTNIPRSINTTHKRNTEIRIDYPQHALSAMILYHEIFYE